MAKFQKSTQQTMMIVGAITLSLGFTACGGSGGGSGGGGSVVVEDTVPVTITLGSSDAVAASSSGYITRKKVDTASIGSLIMEITKVTVHKAGAEEEVGENEDESEPLNPEEENENDSGWITLFEANTPGENIILDIVDLSTISQVLTSSNLTPGKCALL